MDFFLQFVAFKTILCKEIRRFTRIWSQTMLPPVISMGLYFIVFGKLIGSQLAPIAQFSYLQFIVPGLIMMSIINSSYANVCFSFFNAKFQRSIEELLVSPAASSTIILGYLGGGIVRGFLVGTLVFGVSCFFTTVHVSHPFITVLSCLLTALVFSLGGLLNGLFARKFDDINLVPTFILTPLTYLGGVFYSIDNLPPFWRAVSLWNPILSMVNCLRYGILGISDISVTHALGATMLLAAAMYSFVWWLFERGAGLKT